MLRLRSYCEDDTTMKAEGEAGENAANDADGIVTTQITSKNLSQVLATQLEEYVQSQVDITDVIRDIVDACKNYKKYKNDFSGKDATIEKIVKGVLNKTKFKEEADQEESAEKMSPTKSKQQIKRIVSEIVSKVNKL